MQPARGVFICSLLAVLIVAALMLFVPGVQPPVIAGTEGGGSLQIVAGGKTADFCPLRHTDVKAAISGFVARVIVTQEFENPSTRSIEAVYTFPLPQDAAVDDMTIQVGSRTIRGMIKRREEAAAIYAKAIQQGKTAALLDQERPNIFTQTVGNIPPGSPVHVTISYLVRLKFEDGAYEFVFPMVVGPRYVPGSTAIGKQGGGFSPDTDQVPDASRTTPPIAPPGTRAGHDISIAVALDAGIPIEDIRSTTHEIEVEPMGATSALVRLKNASELPNKDFVFRYNVAGSAIAEGLLTHATPRAGSGKTTDGYFTLVIQPPQRFPDSDVTPKEIVFVLDSSGSMNGFPTEKCKRFMDYAIDGLYPNDTFNVIKFSGDTAILFKEPVYPSAEHVRRAREFVNSSWGGGGTEMMKAIRAALAPSDSSDHVRIVVFMTDGYVDNDMEIVSEIQKHPHARIFAYGVGSGVNRFLLDKMAEAGRGAVEYVSYKQDDGEAETAAHNLYERLRAPLLTDISLDFGSLPVADVYPRRISDLFSAGPVVVTGRYTSAARGSVHLTAKRAGEPFARDIAVEFPDREQRNDVLPSLWARNRIEDLMSQDWAGLQNGNMRDALQKQITQIGLDYRLMTQFTSFVAVEERVVTKEGKPTRIQVPVELPAGVEYEEGWSGTDKSPAALRVASPSAMPKAVYGGVPGGTAGGVVGGIIAPQVVPRKAASSGSGAGIGSGSGGVIGSGVYRVQNGAPESDRKKETTVRPLDVKLHPKLLAAYDCWRQQPDKALAPTACKLAGEKMLVQIILTPGANATEQLKAAGLELQPGSKAAGRLVGWIRVEQLAALAEIKSVQFVVPAGENRSGAGA